MIDPIIASLVRMEARLDDAQGPADRRVRLLDLFRKLNALCDELIAADRT